MTDCSPYVVRLRAELVAAVDAAQPRRRARSHRLTLTAVGAVAVLALATMLPQVSSLGPFGPKAALAITRDGQWATVRLVDPAAGIGAMRRELSAAGIAGDVRSVATSPSLVGRWIGAVWLGPEATGAGEDQTQLPRLAIGGDSLRVPVSGTSSLVMMLGRRAAAGEPYQLANSAFVKGEALACVRLVGRASSEAAQAVEQLGYRVSWFEVEVLDPEGSIRVRAVSFPPPGAVSGAEAESDATIRLFVVPPGRELSAARVHPTAGSAELPSLATFHLWALATEAEGVMTGEAHASRPSPHNAITPIQPSCS